MKIEDIEKEEEVEEGCSYGRMLLNVPFVKTSVSKKDEKNRGFFVKKQGGLLHYHFDYEWPDVLTHNYFAGGMLFRVCTPKRAMSEWRDDQ